MNGRVGQPDCTTTDGCSSSISSKCVQTLRRRCLSSQVNFCEKSLCQLITWIQGQRRTWYNLSTIETPYWNFSKSYTRWTTSSSHTTCPKCTTGPRCSIGPNCTIGPRCTEWWWFRLWAIRIRLGLYTSVVPPSESSSRVSRRDRTFNKPDADYLEKIFLMDLRKGRYMSSPQIMDYVKSRCESLLKFYTKKSNMFEISVRQEQIY